MNVYEFLCGDLLKGVKTDDLLHELQLAGHSIASANEWLDKHAVSGFGISVMEIKQLTDDHRDYDTRNPKIIGAPAWTDIFFYGHEYHAYYEELVDGKWVIERVWKYTEWPIEMMTSEDSE